MSKLENHLDTPTPRCFPNWMRRLNPYLQREDTNALFEMQIRIKKVYEKPPFVITPKFLMAASLPVGFLFLFLFWSIIPIYVAMGFFFIASFFINNKRSPNQRRPFQEDFFLKQASKGLLIDLWVCGIGGKEIFEYQYLQTKKRNELQLPLIVFFCFFGFWSLIQHHSLFVNCTCFIISFTLISYFCYQAVLFRVTNSHFLTGGEYLTKKIHLQHFDRNPLGVSFKQNFNQTKSSNLFQSIKYYLSLFIITMISATVFLCYLYIMLQDYRDYFGITNITLLSILAGAFGFYLSWKRRRVWFRDMRKTLKYLNELDQLYPNYFRYCCFGEGNPVDSIKILEASREN
jgi:hypothetical protein